MKNITLLLLIAILTSCNVSSDITQIEYLFAPSFMPPTKFTINIKNKTIKQYTYQDSYTIKEQIDSNTYRNRRKDTLIVHYLNTFQIGKQNLNKFLDKIKTSQLDSTVIHRRHVFDGIGLRVRKINSKKDTISLTSNSPVRTDEFKMDYILLDAFFELSQDVINDYKAISIIENIQDYFLYGLPIKKVSDNPIEFRVWGSLTGCREDNSDLLNFLNDLPNEESIIFDLRNGSIAYCLNEVFEEFSQKKDIYIYGERRMKNSKKIMDEIKLAENNGEILSKLRISAYNTHKRIYEYCKNNKIRLYLTKEEVLTAIANKK